MKRLLSLLIVVATLASCASQKEILYFQDVEPNSAFDYQQQGEIALQPDDQVMILVSSKNQELADMFNQPLANVRQTMGQSSSSSVGYVVDSNGNIDFPILGELHIAGQTREELVATIKELLIAQGLLSDPIVTVTFSNLKYYVLGEISKPGSYDIERSRTTILEAISSAGDLTIHGQRGDIYLTRNVGKQKITYQMDLRSKDIYQSPAFYVQQNDVIYVEPNQVRANQSTVNGNTVLSASFWMSLISFITTMTLIFI